ncbi:MAG: ABC1 kinase family protein [Bythopirellula sp.]
MAVSDLPQLVRNAARFREVVAILAKYGFAGWLQATNAEWARNLVKDGQLRELGELSREARVREAITELGTTFIKLGQVLSTRPDLVGIEMADELAELRTGTPPDPPDTVKAIVQAELGAPTEELYREFDEDALASASIGQVHQARLQDGTAVVVKVQHPGIETRVRNDLEIIARLAELAEKYSPELSQYRPVDTAADFSRTLTRELDFRGELRNLERFRRNFRNDQGVRFPKPYGELSTQRVLTMDLLEGINLSDSSKLQATPLDLEDVARSGANLFIEMIFRDAYYHADPHPGNLMVLVDQQTRREQEGLGNQSPPNSSDEHPAPGPTIGVLDCGMVGQLDEPLREDIEQALLAVGQGDSSTVVDIIMRLGATPDDLNPDNLRLDVEDFLGEYAHQTLDGFDLSGCLSGIIDIIRRHQIVLPAKIGMLLKVLIMLEGTAQQLSPTFNLAELIEPYGKKSLRDRFSPQKLFQRAASRYRDWDNLLEILPRDAADILHRMKKGSFDVHLNHRRLESTVNRLVLGILTAALFMGSTSLWSQQVPPLAWGVSVPGVAGSLLAVWLGATLVRAIKRTGDIQQK